MAEPTNCPIPELHHLALHFSQHPGGGHKNVHRLAGCAGAAANGTAGTGAPGVGTGTAGMACPCTEPYRVPKIHTTSATIFHPRRITYPLAFKPTREVLRSGGPGPDSQTSTITDCFGTDRSPDRCTKEVGDIIVLGMAVKRFSKHRVHFRMLAPFGVRWLDTAFFLSFFSFFLSIFLFFLSFPSCNGERVRNERKDQSGVKPPHSKGGQHPTSRWAKGIDSFCASAYDNGSRKRSFLKESQTAAVSGWDRRSTDRVSGRIGGGMFR